ncbi:Permease of the drug/metabolite transporter (DMT) superfamily [Candidatus Rhodobacter oscarellae]|uniref:Permease of the drug/metabolite transporter (DMT) superfamily n=1 Tax=Candidatus Rhodobacter oscarellae TaxID=1675527 RepID=A0A0J9ECD8_9RHOB|nr:DMT family transporter [Candidatus Rhodobacter lobularis]KMW60420.1 Permease of the drug/metabolite transporter (DMT) superfamily [Candidatus Rhodobacter lobularis]
MDLRAIAMGVAFAFMWASAFSSARIIVAEAPPLTALAIRFFLSGLIAIGIAWALGQSLRLTRAQWIATAIFGLCQNTLYLGFNFVAMQWIEAGLATIIAATMPLLVAFAGWAFLGQRVRPLGAVGLAAGFAGVAIIMGARLSQGVDLFGVLLCVLGVVSLTAATMLVRSASSGGNIVMIIGLQMVIGSAGLALAAVPLETWEVNWTWPLALAFLYTLFVPGLIATWVWFLLVARIGAVRAATFHFLTPPFGVGVAALLLGERLSWLDALGVGVVAVGILAVQLSKEPQPSLS